MTRRRWLAAALTIVLVAAAAVLLARRSPARATVDAGAVTRQARFVSTASASGEIVATRYADIGSSAMGKIVELPVSEGERVAAGQLLARIDPVRAQSDVAGASAHVDALEAEQRAAAEQVRAANADLTAADARARDAGQQFARSRELSEAGLLPASELETARAAADAAAAQVGSSRAGLDRARQAADAASRRVAQARAQTVSATDTLAKTAIVSPITGVVTRLRVRAGEMVVVGIQNQPGTTLMTISDLSAINADVKVAEADVLRLAVGQRASVTLEALPGQPFPGAVVEIGASALPAVGTGAAAREFKVAVRLDQPEPGLRSGMTCDAEIITSERLDVLTVPLQSVVLRRDAQGGERSGVFVIEDGQARFTPVVSGVIGGLDIEVSGVDERAMIVVGPYQVLRELNDGAVVRVSAPGGRD